MSNPVMPSPVPTTPEGDKGDKSKASKPVVTSPTAEKVDEATFPIKEGAVKSTIATTVSSDVFGPSTVTSPGLSVTIPSPSRASSPSTSSPSESDSPARSGTPSPVSLSSSRSSSSSSSSPSGAALAPSIPISRTIDLPSGKQYRVNLHVDPAVQEELIAYGNLDIERVISTLKKCADRLGFGVGVGSPRVILEMSPEQEAILRIKDEGGEDISGEILEKILKRENILVKGDPGEQQRRLGVFLERANALANQSAPLTPKEEAMVETLELMKALRLGMTSSKEEVGVAPVRAELEVVPATPLEMLSRQLELEPGAFVARMHSTSAITLAQQSRGWDEEYAKYNHIAVVLPMEGNKIRLLEAVKQGLVVNAMDFEEFVAYVHNGLAVISHPERNSQSIEHLKQFEMSAKVGKISYQFRRLLSSPFAGPHETFETIERTIRSLHAGRLMDADGKPRKAAICSEVATEISKISQILTQTKKESIPLAEITVGMVRGWQKAHKVIALDSKGTIPAQFVKSHKDMGYKVVDFSKEAVQKIYKEITEE